jgi:hypothetical protein
MEHKYSKLNKKTLKGEILITSRNTYIELIAKDFLKENIIPIEYIDKNIQLENMYKNPNILIDDTLRLKYITELLSKECIKGTAQLIATICM